MKAPKRRVTFRGLHVNVEVEAGERLSGVGEDGAPWSHVYDVPYGELAQTRGADGDALDVYLGRDEAAPLVFVVEQKRLDGSFDEEKAFLGFPDEDAAVAAYRRHGPPWGLGPVRAMPFARFALRYGGVLGPTEGAGARADRGAGRYGRRE